MVVTVTTSDPAEYWAAYEGTLQEVLDQMETDGIHTGDVENMFHDGTNYVALVRLRS